MKKIILAAFAFGACIGLSNVLTSQFGLIPVGFGFVATAGTWTAGLALLARDWLQDVAGRWAVLAAIALAAVCSAVMAGPQLALASGVAFAVSEAFDMAVYTPLRERSWALAVLVSNTVGALVDTLLFLALAGFPILIAVPGQMFAKITATVVVVAPVVMVRAVLRDRVRTASA